MGQRTFWSDAELNSLRTNYPSEGARGHMRRYPHRTYHSVHVKVSKLGLRMDDAARYRHQNVSCADLLTRIRSASEVDENGCWNWTRCLSGGYGKIAVGGQSLKACRVAWSCLHEREWPTPLHSLHSCDNRRCVNPEHIRPGTNAENIKEAWERGRFANRHAVRRARKQAGESQCRT